MPLGLPGKFSLDRAEMYDKYRLPYSHRAVARLLALIGRPVGAMADIGAGTGLVARHFIDNAENIYAIDPEPAMLQVAKRNFKDSARVTAIEGYAEETGLPDNSLDLIVVGNAFHRFDPEPTVTEFGRILKPGGWLALFGYGWEDAPVNRALNEAMEGFESLGARMRAGRHGKPAAFFYGAAVPSEIREPQAIREAWEQVWGGYSSGMESPTPEDGWYDSYKAAVKNAFDNHAKDGVIEYLYSTVILAGQPDYRL